MPTKLALILFGILAAVSANVQVTLQSETIEQLKTIYVPKIFSQLQDITLGNIALPINKKHMGANLTSSEIRIGYANANKDVQVSVSDSIRLQIQNVNISARSNLTQWFFFVKNTHGRIDAEFTNLNLDLQLKLDTQTKVAGGPMSPKILVDHFSFGFDKAHSTIKISGGALPWTENLIESVIQNWLFGFLIKEINLKAKPLLESGLNKEILDFGTDYTLAALGFDFSLTSKPVVNGSVVLNVNATFFGVDNQTGARFYPAPKTVGLRQHKASTHGANIRVGQELFQSLLTVMASGYPLSLSAIVERFTGEPLNTEHLTWIPNVDNGYPLSPPQDIPVDLSVVTSANPTMTLEAGRLLALGDLRFILLEAATKATIADVNLVQVAADFSLETNQFETIRGHFNKLVFDDAVVVNEGSALVKDADAWKFSGTFDHVRDFVNDHLSSDSPLRRARVKSLFGLFFSAFELSALDQQLNLDIDLDPVSNVGLRGGEFLQN